MLKLKGSCLCGGIEFEIEDELKLVMNCHCQFCRKAHSAPYITFISMPKDRFSLLQGNDLLKKYSIRGGASREFCTECGTRIINNSIIPGIITVFASNLEKQALAKPIANVNVESKDPNFVISDGLPCFNADPEPEEFVELLS